MNTVDRLGGRWVAGALVGWLTLLAMARGDELRTRAIQAAQALGKERPAVGAQPDGLIVCEGEEFQVRSGGWEARSWGDNYYAATLANTFLSRKAFLGAPAAGPRSVAQLDVVVPAAGKYLALVRYEAAYRFETQFTLRITQAGRVALDRKYGARDNLKIWAFGQKLKKEVAWDWGANENVVWEGHDALVELQPGRATLELIADAQPEPAAKRNVDCVVLTSDTAQVAQRIEKEAYLPLDGLLTQSGDVFVKVHNLGSQPVVVGPGQVAGGGLGQQHSPYWVHQRNWPKLAPIAVPPGKTSDWVEIGGLLDSLNDGQLSLVAKGEALHYRLEFGVRAASGQVESIAKFDAREPALPLAFHADTRYSRLVRHQADVLHQLLDHLKRQNLPGQPPVRVPVYAHTFEPLAGDERHAAAVREFQKFFSLSTASDGASPPGLVGPRGYVDVRSVPTDKLAEFCQKLGDRAAQIRVVSMGDEIGLAAPTGAAAGPEFHSWLKSQNVTPEQLEPSAGADWSKVVFTVDPKAKEAKPALYYWSMRYRYHFGIQNIKQRTDILRKHLPNARIGANFSPHHGGAAHAYLGETFQWVSCFRDEGLTLPWSEDYVWQVPVGSPQMNEISLDLARAGLRGKPTRDIMFYVMPHWPGNTPAMWRRMFYSSLGHGATMLNLFEFRPVQVAYTENHVTNDETYVTVARALRELGGFEELIAEGTVAPGVAALWFSETSDIWHDTAGSQAAAKRALFTAIRHQQLPLDFVVEQDAQDGALSKYQVLFLADAHVSTAASRKIAQWVEQGGRLFATAGAGMFDETNRPNTVLRELLGVADQQLDAPADAQIAYIKQDLPFARVLDQVTLAESLGAAKPAGAVATLPVVGVRAKLKVASGDVVGKFSDGSAAIVRRTVGKGQTIACGFLPSLSYYHSAIPRRPVDRGSSDDAMAHFLPTEFHLGAAKLIGQLADDLPRRVSCSERLVEPMLIESPKGRLVILVNWTPQPIQGLKVRLAKSLVAGKVTLAGGGAVTRKDDGDYVELTLDLAVADAIKLAP